MDFTISDFKRQTIDRGIFGSTPRPAHTAKVTLPDRSALFVSRYHDETSWAIDACVPGPGTQAPMWSNGVGARETTVRTPGPELSAALDALAEADGPIVYRYYAAHHPIDAAEAEAIAQELWNDGPAHTVVVHNYDAPTWSPTEPKARTTHGYLEYAHRLPECLAQEHGLAPDQAIADAEDRAALARHPLTAAVRRHYGGPTRPANPTPNAITIYEATRPTTTLVTQLVIPVRAYLNPDRRPPADGQDPALPDALAAVATAIDTGQLDALKHACPAMHGFAASVTALARQARTLAVHQPATPVEPVQAATLCATAAAPLTTRPQAPRTPRPNIPRSQPALFPETGLGM